MIKARSLLRSQIPEIGQDPTRWATVAVEQYWGKHSGLVEKLQRGPLAVHLEGPPGAGKADVVARWTRMGGSGLYRSFLKAVLDRQGSVELAERELDAEFGRAMRDALATSADWRSGLLMTVRSPLAGSVHRLLQMRTPELREAAVRELAARRAADPALAKAAILWCTCDPWRRTLTLAQRLADGQSALERETRVRLGADEESVAFLEEASRHVAVIGLHVGLWDAEVHTTSSKQGTAQLLSMLGVNPSLFKEER